MKRFYVYGLVDPRNSSIFYIGKGKGKRALQHEKEVLSVKSNTQKLEIIEEIKREGYEVEYIFFCENLSEDAALLLEKLLIYRFGRRVFEEGTLCNLVPGGKWNKGDSHFILESELPNIQSIEIQFPELMPILAKYPHKSKEFIDSIFYRKIEQKVVFHYAFSTGRCSEKTIDDIIYLFGYCAGVDLIKELKNSINPVLFIDSLWSTKKICEIYNFEKIPFQNFDSIDFNFIQRINHLISSEDSFFIKWLYPNGNKQIEYEVSIPEKTSSFSYFYSSGNIKHSTKKNDKTSRNEFKFWYPSGILKEETVSIQNLNNFVSRIYYSLLGNIEKSDVQDGKKRIIKNWYSDGKIKSENIYEYSELQMSENEQADQLPYSSLKLSELEYAENGILIKESCLFYPYGILRKNIVSGYEKVYSVKGVLESSIDYTT